MDLLEQYTKKLNIKERGDTPPSSSAELTAYIQYRTILGVDRATQAVTLVSGRYNITRETMPVFTMGSYDSRNYVTGRRTIDFTMSTRELIDATAIQRIMINGTVIEDPMLIDVRTVFDGDDLIYTYRFQSN